MKFKPGMLRRLSFALLMMLTLTAFASSAFAGGNDLSFDRICVHGAASLDDKDPKCADPATLAAFGLLARSYGSLFAPMHLQSAASIGQEGFAFSVGSKMSFSAKKGWGWKALNKHAKEGKEDNNPSGGKEYAPPSLFATTQLNIRKGLPFSFEVEGSFSWLVDSEMFYAGAGIRWAVLEGFDFLPDISVRGHVGTILGSSMLQMINLNLDAAISYSFGIAGVVSLTPYAGYSMLMSWANTRAFPVQYLSSKTNRLSQGEVALKMDPFPFMLSRGFAGLELKADYFIFGVEGEFGKDLMSVGAKLGAQF